MKRFNKNMKCLVIVAHPDDEIIWMGGYMIEGRKKGWDLEIICLCRANDSDRKQKFLKVCKELGADCSISDLDDEKLGDIEIREVISRIKEMMRRREYDYIFTHGENGEYGHKRHIDVYKAVDKMIKDRELGCKKVFFFAYEGKNESGKFCSIDRNANKFIKLPKSVYLKKIHLIKNIYGFNENSFEVKSSGNAEAFKVEEK